MSQPKTLPKRSHALPVVYAPGYFTALVCLHNWPPGFVSRLDADPGEVKRREAAVRGRATQLANGKTGTILNGLSRKSAAQRHDASKAAIV